MQEITNEVPQITVQGPILLTIFLNSLSTKVDTEEDWGIIQEKLDDLEYWSNNL